MIRFRIALCALLACAATLAPALAAPADEAAIDVAGVEFAGATTLGQSRLELNGAGMRNKFFFKVYAMALYLPQPQHDAAAVLAAPGAKRMRIVTLRELTARQFADALIGGLRKNYAAAALAPLQARIVAFEAKMLALKTAPAGTAIDIDWLPGSGTRLFYDGARQGDDIPGEDFYRALLAIWLGDRPAAQDLKAALLGNPR